MTRSSVNITDDAGQCVVNGRVAVPPAILWRTASARADRVLFVVMAILIGIAGTIFGSALVYSPAPIGTVRLMNTIVEYVRVPAGLVSGRVDDGREAGTKLPVQHRCLADATYYEARGEGENGEIAVAEVIFHRLQGGGYGHSICSVVYPGTPHRGCQFSFACDWSTSRPNNTRTGPKQKPWPGEFSRAKFRCPTSPTMP